MPKVQSEDIKEAIRRYQRYNKKIPKDQAKTVTYVCSIRKV